MALIYTRLLDGRRRAEAGSYPLVTVAIPRTASAPQRRVLALSAAAPQKENSAVKFVISGGVAWVYEFMCGHALEFLKIQKQVMPGSYFSLIKTITQQKGIIGIWDGFFPWGSVQAIAKGAVFGGAHAFAANQLEPLVEEGRISHLVAEVMAGGIGGGFQGFVLSPTLLLKTRVMTDPIFRTNMTLWETSVQSAKVGMKVIRNEGVAALMKGSVTFAMKRVADWATRFYFSVLIEDFAFKRGDPAHKLTGGEKVAASLLGGTASALVTLPMDVMVAQIQQASKAGQKVSIITTFQEKFKAGGWEGVAGFACKGFVARVIHVALTTALMKSMTSMVYDVLYGDKDEK